MMMNRRRKGKISPVEDEIFSENGIYYKKLADKYHIAGIVVLVLAAVFLFAMLFTGHRALRRDNFRYLVKYLGVGPLSLDTRYSDVVYAAGGGVKFTMYRGDLAVIGDGRTVLYNLAGTALFRENEPSGTTAYAVGGYLAVYVPGGETLSLYNSYSRVHTASFENPIGLVTVAENGAFAVYGKKNAVSVVSVFDSDFREVYTWESEELVYDLALSADGKTLAVLTLSSAGGAYSSTLTVKNTRADSIVTEERFDGKKPVAVRFFSDGRFMAAVDGTLNFYRAGGARAQTVSLSAGVSKYETNENHIAVLLSASEAVIYTSRGTEGARIALPGNALDVCLSGDLAAFLSENAVFLYRTDGALITTFSAESGVLDFFILDDGSVLLCYASVTERLVP